LETSQQKGHGLARLQSIDILRGAVMIIMAIDHVRVYSGIPAGGPTVGIFFTRWITHFCAPAFVFFAGTSAFLYLQKSGDKNDLAKFLVTRGLLLVLLELTVVRCSWMFNFDFVNFTFTGVIWTLGWGMVILAAFLRLRPSTIGVIGLIIIFAQQAFQFVPNIFPSSIRESVATIWGFFYPSVSDHVSGATKLSGISGLQSALGIRIFYVLIPWIGAMMAGYGFGQFLLLEPTSRVRICFRIGFSAILLFLVAGTAIILLQSPGQGGDTPFIFKLLGQQKYPPSQLYLLMTLGPLIALIPWADKIKGWFADAIKMVGRVPMFYYLVHIPLIHLSAFVVNFIRTGSIHQDWYTTVPFLSMPEEQRWGLPLLYLVWAIDVIILYFVCRAYAQYKSNHPEKGWLKYL
jgi:uncharacterized membrane protein